jgi:hypothetical protein
MGLRIGWQSKIETQWLVHQPKQVIKSAKITSLSAGELDLIVA